MATVDDPVANFGPLPSLRSSGVDRGQQHILAINSRLKRATDTGVVSLRFCPDASTDKHHDLLGSTCDLT